MVKKWSTTVKAAQNGPKQSKTVKNGPKHFFFLTFNNGQKQSILSTAVKNCQKWSKTVNLVKNGQYGQK